MMQRIYAVFGAAMLAGAGWLGYQVMVSQRSAEVFRQRLEQLHSDYEQLRHTYNQAVTRTAVTELVVENGQLSVVVRTIEGLLKQVPTSLDPSSEIYVDYIVLDSRLWIRRVFDQHTSPQQGVVIDPLLEQVDWDSARVQHGKAVYRRLGEGRWVITVTGDGSLGLARVQGDHSLPLQPAPPIGEFEPMDQPMPRRDRIGPLDLLGR